MRGRLAIGTLTVGALGGTAWRLLSRRMSGNDTHRSQHNEHFDAAGHRILILGGGFGGLETALALDEHLPDDTDASVMVVDRSTSMVFTPLLWMVADGRSGPSSVVVPIRAFQRGRDFHVMRGEIERIDLDRKVVTVADRDLPYDTLVLALGSMTTLPDLPGLKEHARLFRSAIDAIELRDHVTTALEAAHRTDDPDERREWLTFVVGGGGDTGVELAATISDFIHEGMLTEYPWLKEEPVRIVLAGRADRLLPMGDSDISRAVTEGLRANGIDVRTGVSIEAVSDRVVTTSEGEVPARTLFWAAGIAPPQLVRDLPVKHAKNGAIIVDDHLRVPDRPEVYVVGDSAWAEDVGVSGPLPPTAQAAQHAARHVGREIARRLAGAGGAPFRFEPKGHLATVGHRSGVAKIGGVTLTGMPAWLLWHAYYLYAIPAWGNRLHLVADWLLAMLTGRQTAQLRLQNMDEA